jgi:hypothetical protein
MDDIYHRWLMKREKVDLKLVFYFKLKQKVVALISHIKKYHWEPRTNMISMTNIKAYMIYMSIFLFLIMPLYFCLHSSEQSVSDIGIALPHI